MDDGFVQVCLHDGPQAGSGSHDQPDPKPVSARRAGLVLVGIGACLLWPVPLGGALVMATGLIGSTFVTRTGAR